jgi:hypothetical protein
LRNRPSQKTLKHHRHSMRRVPKLIWHHFSFLMILILRETLKKFIILTLTDPPFQNLTNENWKTSKNPKEKSKCKINQTLLDLLRRLLGLEKSSGCATKSYKLKKTTDWRTTGSKILPKKSQLNKQK